MATGPLKGLQPAKKVGSGPDNGGFDTYEIASAYATAIYTGDPVTLVSGKIQRAANGANVVGVFMGCSYVDQNGVLQQKASWPAAYAPPAGTVIQAKVMGDPFRTYLGVGSAAVGAVNVGDIFPIVLSTGSTYSGVSNATINVAATVLPAAGMVKVQKIVDVENRVLEVTLVNQLNRDNG